MTAALVGTSGLAVVCVIGILVLVGWVRSEVTRRGEEQDKRTAAEALRSRAERDRDEALAAAVKATEERDLARRETDVYAVAVQRAREELATYVRANLDDASDDDVAAELDRLLQAEVRPLRGAAEATRGGDGGAGAGSLPSP